jgi:HK97 gp10 family phage protein
MMIPIKIKIDNKVINLRQLAAELARDVVASAMAKVAAVMRDLMKTYAPVRDVRYWSPSDRVPPGALARSIAFKIVVNLRTGRVLAIVGPRTRAPGLPTHYAHLVEFGHILVVTNHRGGKRTAGYVAANPFVRPAVEAFKGAVLQVLGAEVAAGLSVKINAMMGGKRVAVEV